MSDSVPVSCLMVTLPSDRRAAFAKRAISAYCAQSHPSKELVIVLDSGSPSARADLASHVAGLGRSDISLFEAPPGQTLGALRNLSLARASGAVFCQWDDDDLHHAGRIERQLQALRESGSAAIGLQDAMLFFPMKRQLYWTNWRMTPATILPSTIMMHAHAQLSYPETGPEARRGEDTHVCGQLLARNDLVSVAGAPELYVYVSHGANTWGDDHHAMLAEELGLSHGLLRRREDWLRERLSPIQFGPGPIEVRGRGGAAFTLYG